MTAQSAFAMALFVAYLVGGAVVVVVMDWVLFKVLGHTATISHGMYEADLLWPWVRHAWTFLGLFAVLGLRAHFFGWKW
jgi:hypothetical protein